MVGFTFISTLVSLAFAAIGAIAMPIKSQCSVSHAEIELPECQFVLAEPTIAPHFVALAIGVQNYTCDAKTHKFVAAGAVADLVDASCLPMYEHTFPEASEVVYESWIKAKPTATPKSLVAEMDGRLLGQHYFVHNSTGGISPKWDFSAKKDLLHGNHEAYVIGSVVGTLPSPDSTKDINWLEIKRVSGGLASTIYRTDTRGGTPPAGSCTPKKGGVLSVRYTAVYWFYGGSIYGH